MRGHPKESDMTRRDIYVYADWQNIKKPMLMGVLTSDLLRGKEVFSFEYKDAWLSSGFAHSLDPDLQLYSGLQYLNDADKINFGMFLDSAPDRWGRVLMQRKEAAESRLYKRTRKKLFETDYL